MEKEISSSAEEIWKGFNKLIGRKIRTIDAERIMVLTKIYRSKNSQRK